MNVLVRPKTLTTLSPQLIFESSSNLPWIVQLFEGPVDGSVSQNWYMAPLKTTGLLILRCARFYVSGLDSHNTQLQVMVSYTAINHVCELYINPTHPVFDLLPPTLSAFIDQCYNQCQAPDLISRLTKYPGSIFLPIGAPTLS